MKQTSGHASGNQGKVAAAEFDHPSKNLGAGGSHEDGHSPAALTPMHHQAVASNAAAHS